MDGCRYAEHQAITRQDALVIIREVCDALGLAHEYGGVHGDFSTANVFYTTDKVAMVFDLGIRQSLKELVPIPPSVYASKSVLQGNPAEAVDDIYSVAVVSYELLCGRHPYGTSAVEASEASPWPHPRSFGCCVAST